jgi:2,3-diketo-5-methylthio-1-phosphopentane phosphatase
MNKNFKIFIDFDGTITKTDVGDALFMKFGNKQEVEKIISDLLANRISAKECWNSLCRSIDYVDDHSLKEFIKTIQIDKTFPGFVNFCRENNFDFFVLSDGFDYYIDIIFEKEKLTGVKYFSNKLTIENGKLVPEFPYYDPQSRTSANCKRNHIINNSSDEDFTVYIGDGNSDKYTSQFCDFIFAKDDLLKFCERERITFFPFNNFNDVIEKLNTLISKKRLKKRHQAELKRKEAYLQE